MSERKEDAASETAEAVSRSVDVDTTLAKLRAVAQVVDRYETEGIGKHLHAEAVVAIEALRVRCEQAETRQNATEKDAEEAIHMMREWNRVAGQYLKEVNDLRVERDAAIARVDAADDGFKRTDRAWAAERARSARLTAALRDVTDFLAMCGKNSRGFDAERPEQIARARAELAADVVHEEPTAERDKLTKLAADCSKDNWDSYHADAITSDAISAARAFIDSFHPYPLNDGGVNLAWLSEGVAVEINGTGLVVAMSCNVENANNLLAVLMTPVVESPETNR